MNTIVSEPHTRDSTENGTLADALAHAECLFTAVLYTEEQHATRRADRAWNAFRETFTAQHGPRAWGALCTLVRERAYQNLDAERLAQSAERRTEARSQAAVERHARRRGSSDIDAS